MPRGGNNSTSIHQYLLLLRLVNVVSSSEAEEDLGLLLVFIDLEGTVENTFTFSFFKLAKVMYFKCNHQLRLFPFSFPLELVYVMMK